MPIKLTRPRRRARRSESVRPARSKSLRPERAADRLSISNCSSDICVVNGGVNGRDEHVDGEGEEGVVMAVMLKEFLGVDGVAGNCGSIASVDVTVTEEAEVAPPAAS